MGFVGQVRIHTKGSMSANESPLSEQARDLLGDIAWELEYLVKELDPSGKNRDYNDARNLVQKYKMLEKEESKS